MPNGGKWEVGVTEVGLTDLGKRIFGADVLVRLSILLANIVS